MALRIRATIRLVVFLIFFLGITSVSFLVEAHDIPDEAKARAIEVENDSARPEQEYGVFQLSDVANGLASWYGKGFHGRRTASGRKYNMHELTAAHRSLPFGTLLRVVNTQTEDTIIVEVTDRGPFIKRRVVDLSYESARKIGISVTPVELDALTPDAIREFYSDNDSTVLIITQNMQVQIWSLDKVVKIEECTSYSHAASTLNTGEIIITQVDSNTTVYSRGRFISQNSLFQ